eukprot:6250457-Amphidinium_carterae.1
MSGETTNVLFKSTLQASRYIHIQGNNIVIDMHQVEHRRHTHKRASLELAMQYPVLAWHPCKVLHSSMNHTLDASMSGQ